MLDLREQPHRRWNPLTGDWVLVSPHRTQRPWQGQVERVAPDLQPEYDPQCYLCPGNERAGGVRNPKYTSTFVFENDFAALKPDTPAGSYSEGAVIRAESERGICRVLCFSPRHDLTLARMSTPDIRQVVDLWADQYSELATIDWVSHVQIFENRGAMMGASNPHPHGQLWASQSLPNEPDKELRAFSSAKECLLCMYLQTELRLRDRIVLENEHFVAVVPFWAVWPFETLLMSRRHLGSLEQLEPAERDALADVLRRLTIKYDNVFEVSFPYTMGFHQRPTDGAAHPEWHLHAHFYPPLLRSATVRKFMVGYEMLSESQRDITAETAAARLRESSAVHYTVRL